jgi:trk system potassium uptake protein TrkH
LRRLLSIAHILGAMLMLLGAAYLLPIGWSAVSHDGTLDSFLIAAAGTFVAGLLLWAPTLRGKRELQARDGSLLVVITWITLAAAATVPLRLEIPGLSFTDAFFETISALTTTGATLLVGLDALPQSINVWRHLLQWIGGMGMIVMAVAILPLLGVGGMQLFRAETPGPMKETKLTPRITQTASYLWLVYAGATALCIVSLRIAGMNWYEAICHGFSTLSLGGFSTHDANIAAFDSPAIEGVLIVFMLIACLNFTTHFLAFRHRSLAPYARDPEARWVIVSILAIAVLLTVYLHLTGVFEQWPQSIRHAVFNTVSMGTTTGFSSVGTSQWPMFAGLLLLLLCSIASSSGSTGGGIKMIRSLVLCKQALRELLRMSHPRAVRPLVLGGQVVAQPLVLAVLGFMLLYGVTLVGLTLLMVATGVDFTSAFSGVVTCLNNTAPGPGGMGLTLSYLALNDFQTWVFAFAMLAGRLEMVIVFVLFTPAFWRR